MSATAKNQLQDTNNDYVYDAAGNLIQPGPIGGPYVFDAENHLISAGGMAYLYDGDGKRVGKAPANTPTQPNYLYWYGGGSDILQETDGAGHFLYNDFYFNGMRVDRQESDNWVDHFFLDALGNARCVYGDNDPDGGCSDYYPFGGERPISNGGVNVPFKFTSKERDPETGLDNFGARFMGSNLGRFISPDPLMASAKVWDPQTWNRYAYARNNPLLFLDPTGMAEVTAAQCAQDKNCITVNVNVIYDKNANDGKGLTDQQKGDFEKGQLQNAKDQYGSADIHLNVTYTAGSLTRDNGQTSVSGLQAGALNVIVTDQVGTSASGMVGKTAFTFINVNSTNKEDLPHEMAHQFMGDTQGWRDWLMQHDPIITGTFLNAITDVGNNVERAWMRNLDKHSGAFSYYPLASAFHHNADVFQKRIQPTTKPQ